MREREFDPARLEWMDREQPVSQELEADLVNLAAINRRFGGQGIWRFFVARWIQPGGRYRLLDLATGGGDAPRLMADFARKIGATVAITAVDAQPATLALARKWSVSYPEIEFREGDARVPDFSGDAPYDFAFCSLALHHFSEADAVVILRHLGDLGRCGAMCADLARGWVCSAGAWLVTATLYREAMTKHDARMSARRAFSFEEMSRMADAAGWRNFRRRRFLLGRQAIWRESTDAI
jgi:SAM-dependent methyltransferase